MEKRGNHLKFISLFQIILLISFIFAFSFILNSNFVSADEDVVDPKSLTKQEQPPPFNEYGDAAAEAADFEGRFPAEDIAPPLSATTVPTSIFSATQIKKIVEDGRTFCLSGECGILKPVEGGHGLFDSNNKLITSVGENGVLKSSDLASGTVSGVWSGLGVGLAGNLVEGALWAVGVVGAIQLFGSMFGLEDETVNALSKSAAVGIIAAKGLTGLAEQFGGKFGILKEQGLGLQYSTWVGIGVAVLVFVLTYKKVKQETVIFSCLPWQAPTGGSDCEKCNKKDFPCSEYQCRSLGQ